MNFHYIFLVLSLALLSSCFNEQSGESTKEATLRSAQRDAASQSDCPESRKFNKRLKDGSSQAFDLQGNAATGCSVGASQETDFNF